MTKNRHNAANVAGFIVSVYAAILIYDATAKFIDNNHFGLSTLKVLFVGTILFQVAKYTGLSLWILVYRALTGKWYGSYKDDSRTS